MTLPLKCMTPIAIHLTPEMRAHYQALADINHMSLSRYIRNILANRNVREESTDSSAEYTLTNAEIERFADGLYIRERLTRQVQEPSRTNNLPLPSHPNSTEATTVQD